MNDKAIQERIRRETDAAMRDHNKAEGEKAAALAKHHAQRAGRFFLLAECPNFATKAVDAANLLSEVSK